MSPSSAPSTPRPALPPRKAGPAVTSSTSSSTAPRDSQPGIEITTSANDVPSRLEIPKIETTPDKAALQLDDAQIKAGNGATALPALAPALPPRKPSRVQAEGAGSITTERALANGDGATPGMAATDAPQQPAPSIPPMPPPTHGPISGHETLAALGTQQPLDACANNKAAELPDLPADVVAHMLPVHWVLLGALVLNLFFRGIFSSAWLAVAVAAYGVAFWLKVQDQRTAQLAFAESQEHIKTDPKDKAAVEWL